MAQFVVNASRFDPYKNFKFRVRWDGRYVAGISKVSALKRTTEVVKHRDGGDPSSSRKSPGRTEFDAITLERGVTHDTDFEAWAAKVWQLQAGLGSEVSLANFRKDIILEILQRGRPAGDRLQGVPLLGVGVPGAARSRLQRQCGRHPAHQAGERGLGARHRGDRADRAGAVAGSKRPARVRANDPCARHRRGRGPPAARRGADRGVGAWQRTAGGAARAAAARRRLRTGRAAGGRDGCAAARRRPCWRCAGAASAMRCTASPPATPAASGSNLRCPSRRWSSRSATQRGTPEPRGTTTGRSSAASRRSATSRRLRAKPISKLAAKCCWRAASVSWMRTGVRSVLPTCRPTCAPRRSSASRRCTRRRNSALRSPAPHAGATQQVALDPTEFLWEETRHAARRLLADVHELAWAYGWRESDIIGMSPARRAAYLGLVRS